MKAKPVMGMGGKRLQEPVYALQGRLQKFLPISDSGERQKEGHMPGNPCDQ
jgi:hypothetical protein